MIVSLKIYLYEGIYWRCEGAFSWKIERFWFFWKLLKFRLKNLIFCLHEIKKLLTNFYQFLASVLFLYPLKTLASLIFLVFSGVTGMKYGLQVVWKCIISWLKSLSYRNQSISKQINGLVSISWVLYHERVKVNEHV